MLPSIKIHIPEKLPRAWGCEVIACMTGVHACKVLYRSPNTESAARGFQLHVKEESHYLLDGRMLIETPTGSIEVREGSAWTVPPMTLHRETALTDCTIVEVSDPTREDRFRSGEDYGGLRSMTDTEASDKLIALAQSLEARASDCRDLAVHILREGLKSYVP